MAGIKDLVFDPQDLKNLLTHYTEGEIPLSGEVTDFLVHPQLQRKIGLVITSEEWTSADPLFLGYDGKRVRSWANVDGHTEPVWEERAETPRRTN
jgi:hypothetical protein